MVTTGLQEILLEKVKDEVIIGITDMLYSHGRSPPFSDNEQYNKTLRNRHQEKSFSSQKGPTKSKPSSRAAGEPLCSAAQSHNSSDHCDDTLVTLLIPGFDTQVRPIFHFWLETSDWIAANPPVPLPLYLLCDLDKTEPLFSSQNSCPGQEPSGTMTPVCGRPRMRRRSGGS